MTVCIEPAALAAYLDERLDEDERAAIEAHLATCDDCYELMSETLQVRLTDEGEFYDD